MDGFEYALSDIDSVEGDLGRHVRSAAVDVLGRGSMVQLHF